MATDNQPKPQTPQQPAQPPATKQPIPPRPNDTSVGYLIKSADPDKVRK